LRACLAAEKEMEQASAGWPSSGHFDTPVCHYFTGAASEPCSLLGFGEEETISKNKETINNPAIAAPISIYDPISLCLSNMHARFHRLLIHSSRCAGRGWRAETAPRRHSGLLDPSAARFLWFLSARSLHSWVLPGVTTKR